MSGKLMNGFAAEIKHKFMSYDC